jgi:hypothetical protein
MTIYDMCSVIRSKNAGPFKLTFDLFFANQTYYEVVKSQNFVTRDIVAELFLIEPSDVTTIAFLDTARALKVTIVPGSASGDPHNRDVYGAQQGAPLFQLEVPDSAIATALKVGHA